ERVVGFLEICAEPENSAIDARLRFAVEKLPVAVLLKNQMPVDPIDHLASLLAGWIEAEVLQDNEHIERDQQAQVVPRPHAIPGLQGEKLSAPAFARDARPFGCNRIRGGTRAVTHDLPADGGVGIEQPLEMRWSRRVVGEVHWSV